MTDGEYKKQKRRIQKLADRWLPALGLDQWHLDLAYKREGIAASAEDAAENWQCNAQARVKWEYQRATLSFNMLSMEDYDDKELERLFVHECCHALVAEMREWGTEAMTKDFADHALKHEERVVACLTEAFLRKRP